MVKSHLLSLTINFQLIIAVNSYLANQPTKKNFGRVFSRKLMLKNMAVMQLYKEVMFTKHLLS